jgi:hypothetical protein
MEDHDQQGFFQILDTMSEYFSDSMTPLRQRVYWDITVDTHVTLEEWAHACSCAMQETAFHKVPLFGVLMGYITEVREAARLREREHQKSLALEAQLALPPAPQLPEEQERMKLEEILAMLDMKMPTNVPLKYRGQGSLGSTQIDPGELYTGMTEEHYQARRAAILREMTLDKHYYHRDKPEPPTRPMLTYEDAKRLQRREETGA